MVKGRRKKFSRRGAIMLALILAWGGWLLWRLVDIQVIQSANLTAIAATEHVHTFPLPATRGAILGRHGRVLAMDVPAYMVTAAPIAIAQAASQLGDPHLVEDEARRLAEVMPYTVSQLAGALRGRTWYRLIDPLLSPAEAHILQAESAQLPGIALIPIERRLYPDGDVGAQVLGFVNSAGTGVAGIEYEDNSILAGKPGSWTVATDVNGNALPFTTIKRVPPVPGDSVQLTINGTIEYAVQRMLAAQVKKFHAKNGAVVIMDPKTGAVLALVNYPTFNPNDYAAANPNDFTNWAVEDPIPPGSIFKPVTASAGLTDGVVQPTTMFDTVGYKIVDGVRIDDWVPGGWGWISFTRGLELSSNQVFMDVGLRLGTARLYRMIKAFGFFHPSGIGLPGDSAGIFIPESQVNPVDLATIAFGQGIAVTAVQEVTMIDTIANGGTLLKPRIRRAIIGPHGQLIRRFGPVVEGHPITPFVAHEVQVMMEREVGYGTGVPVQVKGYTWAGKTGTAQQIVNGQTSNTDYVSSYAGYGPMPHVRFAMVVMIDHPHGSIYGAEVAAPLWREIAKWLMGYWHIRPYVHNGLPNGVAQGNAIPAGP
jgi:stage V sporulation protein D (sporulation-specific penicillin-binding protein)